MEVKPGYKQTEVGLIPRDWDITPFGRLFAFTNGINADKTAYGKGVRFINVLEPINHSHIYGLEIPGRVEISGSMASAYSVRAGDIVFNRTSETDAELGLAAVYVGDEQVVFGGFVFRGRPIDDTLDPEYSGYALRARMIRSQIIPMGQGAVRANIGQQNLRRVLVAVPPKPEQRAIAAALSDADGLLGGLDRLIAKKRDLKQATMQQLLTGQTRLPGFEGEWEVKQLGDIFEITSSTRVFQSDWRSEGIPFYRARELAVLGETGRVDNELFISRALYDTHRKAYGVPGVGDMLVTGAGTLGKVFAISDDREFYFKDGNIIWFKIDRKMSAEFLRQLYLTEALTKQIAEGAAGTTVGTYTIAGAKRTTIPFPPLAEQTAIAAVLSDMDAELSSLEGRRDKTHALKQGMMQELLTGKTRLVAPSSDVVPVELTGNLEPAHGG